jgi:DNA-binding MarR family transcriptional regulator
MQKPNKPPVASKPRIATSEDKNLKGTLDLTALEQTPGFMIRILQVQIFEDFFEHFSALGFSPAEHSVLITIRDNPSVTQTEVANALRIQLPNLVKLLLKLEASGLIKRKRSSRDKRAVELVLTPSGEAAAARTSKMAETFNRKTLSPLDQNERKQFLLMLKRLVQARTNKADQGS